MTDQGLTTQRLLKGEYCPITGVKLKDYVERVAGYVYAPPGDFVPEWELKNKPKKEPDGLTKKERDAKRYQANKEIKKQYHIKRKIAQCKQAQQIALFL